MESPENNVDYSAPSSIPVVNADGGKVGGAGVEPEGGLFPSQGSGAAEQALQNEVHEVNAVQDGWEHPYEGIHVFSVCIIEAVDFGVL